MELEEHKSKDNSDSRIVTNKSGEWDDNFSAGLFLIGGTSVAMIVPKNVAKEWKMEKGGKLRLKIIDYVKPEGDKKNGKRKK